MRHANSCFFTMVAVNDDGKSVAVTPLDPATPDELRRYSAALARRDLRRQLLERNDALKRLSDAGPKAG